MNIAKLLTHQTSTCSLTSQHLNCAGDGAHYVGTEGFRLHFKFLSTTFQSTQALYVQCLFKPDGKVYKHSNKLHRISEDRENFIVGGEVIPVSCLTSGTHSDVNCESIYSSTPQYFPAESQGISYIQTKSTVYLQSLTSALEVSYKGSKADLAIEPLAVPRSSFPVYITCPDSSAFSLNLPLYNDATENLDVLLTMSHKSLMSTFIADINTAPSLPLKIDELKNIFTSIQDLHDASPAVRGIIWSSVVGLLILLTLGITITICWCCPNSCCCTGRRSSPSPSAPPAWELEELRSPASEVD